MPSLPRATCCSTSRRSAWDLCFELAAQIMGTDRGPRLRRSTRVHGLSLLSTAAICSALSTGRENPNGPGGGRRHGDRGGGFRSSLAAAMS